MIVALLPVKALRGGKQRLAHHWNEDQREALCQALLQDALDALLACETIDRVVVISRDAAARSLAHDAGAESLIEQGGGLNAAVEEGAAWAAAQGADTVLVMHADLPLVNAQALQAVMAAHQAAGAGITLVPDRHGTGSNLLLASPPQALRFAFGENSCERHRQRAEQTGLSFRLHPDARLGMDLDTPADLRALPLECEGGKALAWLRSQQS